ncbi:ABC transporter substrate-binding protein [Streptomyces sp. MZ04]|uniref:ABC transporter substrate-binding protein n=1 Tax=Streptomyces sp. MZ04 TaxID=2559236 RepID=UPI00107E97A0|nr:ABC transporter substrate-binding protein [Streptomyces sp. MZ04]TGB08875.1 ABC transporter substrate-binding protein [Streptomyces sp. MZ04]
MRMSARRAAIALGTATVLLAASACSSGEDSVDEKKPVGAAKGTITWYAMDFGTDNLPQKLVDAFEKSHPDIRVELKPAPSNSDTVRATLTTEISGGSSDIDVYNGDVVWPAQFGDAELALPLDDYVPKSYWKSFAEGRADGTVHDGRHLAAPLFTDEGFLFYRKDLLARHKLPVPKTWEELAATAAELQKSGDVKYGYSAQWANYEGLTADWAELSASAGGSSVSSDGKKSTIDSAANRKALTYMRKLVDDGVAPKAMLSFQEAQSLQAFTSGQAAFHRNWGYAWGESENPKVSKVKGKVGMVALPTFKGRPSPGASNIGGWNMMVNPHSKKLGASLEFIKWMTGTEGQTILAENSMIPVSAKVLGDKELTAGQPVLKAAATTRLVSRPANTPKYARVSKAVYSSLNAALSGSTSVPAALKKADGEIGDALAGSGL